MCGQYFGGKVGQVNCSICHFPRFTSRGISVGGSSIDASGECTLVKSDMDQVPLDLFGVTQSLEAAGAVGGILVVVFVGDAVCAVRGGYF